MRYRFWTSSESEQTSGEFHSPSLDLVHVLQYNQHLAKWIQDCVVAIFEFTNDGQSQSSGEMSVRKRGKHPQNTDPLYKEGTPERLASNDFVPFARIYAISNERETCVYASPAEPISAL